MVEIEALAFAERAHSSIDQRRKYTNEPYIVHPAEVAVLVKSVPHTREMVAAAYLHDTVEDTGVLIEEIETLFGPIIAALVSELTDVSRPEDGSRAVRKAKDLAHTATASPEAKTIKLADLISNSRSIMERDPAFAVIYLREKAALLEVLMEGDLILWKQAKGLLDCEFEAIAFKAQA